MQKNFKLKLQNALNQLTDADSPALIVGGRRRNRKKRRPRNCRLNKRRNKKGESIDNTPAETPQSPRKTFIDPQEVSESKQPLVSCLDIEEPIFAVYPEPHLKKSSIVDDGKSLYNSEESLNNKEVSGDIELHEEETREDLYNVATEDDITDTYETENRKLLPRLHSEDSGVFDDEEDWNQQNLVTFEDDDSALSDNEFDGLDNELPAENKDTIELESEESESNINGTSNTVIKKKAPEIISAEFSEVDPFLTKFEELGDDDKEDVIFDLAELKDKSLKPCEDDISPRHDNDKFQLTSSLYEPTGLEDEVPRRISLDLLSDDDEDVVLFEAGGRKELSIVCNPLYEQSLKEDADDVSVKSYQQGFKTDFENINLIRLPATDKAAQKEMKESSPLIRKTPDDEIACCVIL